MRLCECECDGGCGCSCADAVSVSATAILTSGIGSCGVNALYCALLIVAAVELDGKKDTTPATALLVGYRSLDFIRGGL